jgi:hypothetical protein
VEDGARVDVMRKGVLSVVNSDDGGVDLLRSESEVGDRCRSAKDGGSDVLLGRNRPGVDDGGDGGSERVAAVVNVNGGDGSEGLVSGIRRGARDGTGGGRRGDP